MAHRVPNIVISYPIGDDDCELQTSRSDFFTGMSEWADVTLINPEREIPDKLENEPVDLYHMAKRRTEGLNNLQYAQEYGVDTINPASGARRVNNRVDTLEMLEDLGIPVPDWDVGTYENIHMEPPAVVKTRRETEDGKHDIGNLSHDEPYEGRKLVQDFIPHDEALKLYNVGDEVRTVRLEDDRHDDFVDPRHAEAEEIETPHYMQQYADQIRDETGLEIFEVDVLKDGREVLDANSVPFLADTEDGMDLYEDAIRDATYR